MRQSKLQTSTQNIQALGFIGSFAEQHHRRRSSAKFDGERQLLNRLIWRRRWTLCSRRHSALLRDACDRKPSLAQEGWSTNFTWHIVFWPWIAGDTSSPALRGHVFVADAQERVLHSATKQEWIDRWFAACSKGSQRIGVSREMLTVLRTLGQAVGVFLVGLWLAVLFVPPILWSI